jgi:hypothetical protein
MGVITDHPTGEKLASAANAINNEASWQEFHARADAEFHMNGCER